MGWCRPRRERENGVGGESLPYLGALVCCSVIDQAVHDAYGVLHGVDVYDTYGPSHMSRDLAAFVTPAEGSGVSFAGKFIADYLVKKAPTNMDRCFHAGRTLQSPIREP